MLPLGFRVWGLGFRGCEPPGLGKVHPGLCGNVDDVLHHHRHKDVNAPEIQKNH